MTRAATWSFLITAAVAAGCSSGTPSPTSPPSGQDVAVVVSPSSITVTPGASTTFTAQVTGTASVAVAWSVAEGASCGTISATGLYTAPSSAGTCHVVATSVADSTRTAVATITIAPSPGGTQVVVSPASASLDACGKATFTASVANTTNGAVTWSVAESSGGSVSGGAYVAPATPGTYHVVATSAADPGASAQATVTVGPEKVLSVSVSPASGTVTASGSLQLSATVTTTCGSVAAQ